MSIQHLISKLWLTSRSCTHVMSRLDCKDHSQDPPGRTDRNLLDSVDGGAGACYAFASVSVDRAEWS